MYKSTANRENQCLVQLFPKCSKGVASQPALTADYVIVIVIEIYKKVHRFIYFDSKYYTNHSKQLLLSYSHNNKFSNLIVLAFIGTANTALKDYRFFLRNEKLV